MPAHGRELTHTLLIPRVVGAPRVVSFRWDCEIHVRNQSIQRVYWYNGIISQTVPIAAVPHSRTQTCHALQSLL